MTVQDRYRHFADAIEARPQRVTQELPAKHHLATLIDALPQREVIQDHHARTWLERCWTTAEERISMESEGQDISPGEFTHRVHGHVHWHVRRASAIGGSEAGTVIRHYRGEKGGFTNARNLVLEKLLIMSPVPGAEAMNRGVRAEPWIQRIFHERFGAVTDGEALDRLRDARLEKKPFIIGTPDDVVLMPDGRRLIVDYKCPSAEVNKEYLRNGVSFDYQAQLHHYTLLTKSAGIMFHGLEVVCLDPESFSLNRHPVEPSKELFVELLQAETRLWNNHVMTGELPVVPSPANLNPDDERKLAAMQTLVMQAAVLKMAADEIGTRQMEALNRAKAVVLGATNLSEGRIDAGIATLNRTRKWDEAEIRRMAEAAGIDLEEFTFADPKKPDGGAAFEMLDTILTTARDPHGDIPRVLTAVMEEFEAGHAFKQITRFDEVAQTLEAFGLSTQPAAGIQESFLISRAKKNSEAVNRLRTQAIELVDAVEEAVESEVEKIALGVDDDPAVETDDALEP